MICLAIVFSAVLLAGGLLLEACIVQAWDHYLRKNGYEEWEEDEDGD